MKAKIAKLIDVKSIMTLMLTIVFCVLALTGVVSDEQFTTIFTVIVGFYFGTQSRKKDAAATVVEQGDGAVLPVGGAVYDDAHPPDGAAARVGFEY